MANRSAESKKRFVPDQVGPADQWFGTKHSKAGYYLRGEARRSTRRPDRKRFQGRARAPGAGLRVRLGADGAK
jgi:hypothetical protein